MEKVTTPCSEEQRIEWRELMDRLGVDALRAQIKAHPYEAELKAFDRSERAS